jgi:murein DD-endopeptidase MepM/ murein hydrolase activator NlpD
MLEELLKTAGIKSVVMNPSLRIYQALDLSVFNEELNEVDVSSSSSLGEYISEKVKSTGGDVGCGGYLEQRGIYQRSPHFKQEENTEDERNIHLGIDLWCDEGTSVHAALDGKVHSFDNNVGFGNYGPTIILEHVVAGIKFYTLYGHLSLDSLDGKHVGKEFKKGDKIASLGGPEVNGDYAPHLHFQIIHDIQGNEGDYPGVCSAKEVEFYKQNCPDPSLLLRV